ncbi:D-glycero-beta-D-manno-heptose 1,7-bisphosphate 7-phosphatase [Calderihabitans maritimus]|uniref:D,D-heptose 1,7-bisphosphate phosphatase n=1 Tax=Calderihabitans maritimus TaxID=1246530 RepID=A0A1Z5HXR3_9FIRM|nr:D-glycero-beta-D-manno-heptose 1,7-bisphosphate 7-phosphatase [Calderihabitans maritimus]GAW94070.1 hypothetical protein KKC1_31880 [Calderihabitans maritimus]
MLEQAVILAGGRGSRLKELTQKTPKPLLPVGGRPFLEHLLWNIQRHGIHRFLFLVSYKAEQIREYFGDGSRWGVEIEYSMETVPAGTGGALKHALDKLEDLFILFNGDTIFDFNYLDLALWLEKQRASAAVALREVEDAGRYGAVAVLGRKVRDFAEKGRAGPGLVNGGVYVLRKETVRELPQGFTSLERGFLPRLAEQGLLLGQTYEGFFLDIGLPETLREANELIPRWRRKPAVFFDRDGVLNVDKGYVHRPEQITWVEGAPEAVKEMNDRGWLVFVVTNQSGVARGYYSEEDVGRLHRWMNEELKRRGAHIDAFYYCPHHPEVGRGIYRRQCLCRKPAPGLLQRALAEWPVDGERSLLIGDTPADVAAARAAGIRGLLFPGGNLREFMRQVCGVERP